MTGIDDAPAPGVRRRIPLWMRLAVVKTIAGLILGLTTAVVLVWLSVSVFPGMQDYGHDLGLRVSAYLDRLASATSGTIRAKGRADQFGYVFLDVDPEYGLSGHGAGAMPPSEEACQAMLTHLGTSGAPPLDLDLRCGSARPLNRHLLAQLVTDLASRRPRMIVLDVAMAQEQDVIGQRENDALVTALKNRAGTTAQIPVLFAAPFDAAAPDPAGGDLRVVLRQTQLLPSDPANWLYAAAAVPYPGQPLRRYPKCLVQTGSQDSPFSLPFLAAVLLRSAAPPVSGCAAALQGSGATQVDRNAPRIVFTLPALHGHEDDVHSRDRARWAAYRGTYDRCLAASFWNERGSRCGRDEMYKGKVVVIGASNPLRRDRHYTPLGDMAGAEVVINSIRSFVAFPDNRDKTLPEQLRKKLVIVLWCAGVWFVYFLIRCRCFPPGQGALSRWQSFTRAGIVLVAFFVTVLSVCWLVLSQSFKPDYPVPSMDVLIPVLAIALDEYVEVASKIVHLIEGRLMRAMRIPAGRDH